LDSIDHVLNKFFLRPSESSDVRDIVSAVIRLAVLSVDSSNLDIVLGSDSLKLFLLLRELWELDMNRGSQSSSKIGWARSDVTQMIVMGKFANSLDVSCSSAKSIEYLQDSSSFLHRDNSELILFIYPDQEGLIIVVEDTSSRWPVSVQVTGFQESISFLEKEMIGNKLVLIFCRHTLK